MNLNWCLLPKFGEHYSLSWIHQMRMILQLWRLPSNYSTQSWVFLLSKFSQKQPPDMFCKKGVLRNFAGGPVTLFKKRIWHRCFPVNFAKFLRTPFFQNNLGDCFCLVNTVPVDMELWLSLNVTWSQYHSNWSHL